MCSSYCENLRRLIRVRKHVCCLAHAHKQTNKQTDLQNHATTFNLSVTAKGGSRCEHVGVRFTPQDWQDGLTTPTWWCKPGKQSSLGCYLKTTPRSHVSVTTQNKLNYIRASNGCSPVRDSSCFPFIAAVVKIILGLGCGKGKKKTPFREVAGRVSKFFRVFDGERLRIVCKSPGVKRG